MLTEQLWDIKPKDNAIHTTIDRGGKKHQFWTEMVDCCGIEEARKLVTHDRCSCGGAGYFLRIIRPMEVSL